MDNGKMACADLFFESIPRFGTRSVALSLMAPIVARMQMNWLLVGQLLI